MFGKRGGGDRENVFTTKSGGASVVEHHNNPRMVMDKVVGEVVPDVHNLFPISERFRNFQASSSAMHPPLHSGLTILYLGAAISTSIMCQ